MFAELGDFCYLQNLVTAASKIKSNLVIAGFDVSQA
jgi:hypothetical protein